MAKELSVDLNECAQVIAFNNNFVQLCKDLLGAFPEQAKNIKDCAREYNSLKKSKKTSEFLKTVIDLLGPHISKVSQYDDNIFSDDYQEGPLTLLPHIDFKRIWQIIESDDFESENVAKTKKTIYNYLQVLYICATQSIAQMEQVKTGLDKQKDFLMNMLKNLDLEERLQGRVDEILEEEEGDTVDVIAKISEIFGEDNLLVSVIKEVIEEVNLGNDLNHPVDAITKLMANNGRKLDELIVTLKDKLQKKIKDKGLTPEDIKKDIMKVKDRMTEMISENPELSHLKGMMSGEAQMESFMTDHFETLSPEDKERFSGIRDIMKKGIPEWTEQDYDAMNTFVAHVNANAGANAGASAVASASANQYSKENVTNAVKASKSRKTVKNNKSKK